MASPGTDSTRTPVRKLCCNPLGCRNRGTKRCTGCAGAEPETLYCGVECQKTDWPSHKKYCGKMAYTFEMKLIGSSNPVITRVFDVPSWYTFQQLHCTIQYAMGPWQRTHLHEFTFEVPTPGLRNTLSRKHVVLKIREDNDEMDILSVPENNLYLRDAFATTGRLHRTIAPRGAVLPLYYLYDFGVSLVSASEILFRQ
ncbi:hypothetical protein BDZ94DRAFT_1173732 [Collybia nuda]|uniref:MYND-type domain-containing protein n=1 Tax=Collybia nuda TaxID=64659 RepID=A0A9P6CEW8_9AGAR|nr:hypothetical protein BDZ94DRAFT_1173732 [Collybia nuda]